MPKNMKDKNDQHPWYPEAYKHRGYWLEPNCLSTAPIRFSGVRALPENGGPEHPFGVFRDFKHAEEVLDTEAGAPPKAQKSSCEDVLGKPETHPSFGMAGIYHRTGGRGKFFGSAVRCSSAVSIRICRAEVRHSLYSDDYYGKEELIEILFTPSQFAEFITNPNQGSGVPCTINHLTGKNIERPPEDMKTEPEKIAEDFRKKNKEITDRLRAASLKIRERASKLKKADREAILSSLESFFQEVESNVPFMMGQLNESANKVIDQAKSEFATWSERHIRQAGLEHLKKEAPQLELNSDAGREKN